MKKLIILLLFIPALLIGQTEKIMSYDGKVMSYGGKILSYDIEDQSDYFITEWTLPTAGNFTFPAGNTTGYDAEINFGDGSGWKVITAYNDADLTNNYALAGVYTVKIRGAFPYIYINNGAVKTYLTEIVQWGDIGITKLTNGFYGANKATGNIIIPSGMTTISQSAFYNCNKLTGDGESLIPNGIICILATAFSHDSALTGNLIIPDSDTLIGNYAFRNCVGFDSLKLSVNLNTLGISSFERFNGSGTLDLYNTKIKSIPSKCFYNCPNFTKLYLPTDLTDIAADAFNYSSGITVVHCYAAAAPTVGINGLRFLGTARPIHVPVGATGYDVAPWTTTSIFSEIIFDL